MMRRWTVLLLAAALCPTVANASDAPYYGPMKAWHGIGYKFGFKHEVEDDGSWKVVAATRGDQALDMAMYRAAELARERGFAYVELLSASSSDSPGYHSATVYARPSRVPAQPAKCRSKRANSCYTADVAQILNRLGGLGGTQPGVPVTDHFDKYGRAVSYSGFGTGYVAPGAAPLQPGASTGAATGATAPMSYAEAMAKYRATLAARQGRATAPAEAGRAATPQ